MAAAPAITARGSARSAALARRLHSPLCGIVTDVSSLVRTRYGPQVFLYSGELTGVHMWGNRPDPPPGSFPLGGFGVHRDEALVKLLGESVERYAGHAVLAAGPFPCGWRAMTSWPAAGNRSSPPTTSPCSGQTSSAGPDSRSSRSPPTLSSAGPRSRRCWTDPPSPSRPRHSCWVTSCGLGSHGCRPR